MIRVFVGTDGNIHRDAEKVLEYSIRTNTKEDVDLTFMRPGWQTPPTGFASHRYLVPKLAGYKGFAIYLDVDMLVLGDLRELFDYRQPGKWCVTPVSRKGQVRDDVSVIDCRVMQSVLPSENILRTRAGKNIAKARLNKKELYSVNIPKEWNIVDNITPGAKLIHYSRLGTQPWHPDPNIEYKPHKSPEAVELFFEYLEKANELL